MSKADLGENCSKYAGGKFRSSVCSVAKLAGAAAISIAAAEMPQRKDRFNLKIAIVFIKPTTFLIGDSYAKG